MGVAVDLVSVRVFCVCTLPERKFELKVYQALKIIILYRCKGKHTIMHKIYV